MKIVLLGYMGSGKSIIGRKLSEKLHYNFYDLDDLIEKEAAMSVAELFLLKGEIYFRKIEHEIFATLIANSDNFVLSLGGGTPCYSNNHLLLKKPNIVSIYLSASVNTLFERLKNEQNQRPLIAGLHQNQLKDFIAKNSFERSYFYNQASHKVSVDEKSIETIVAEIISIST
jgi:shikimate kinase